MAKLIMEFHIIIDGSQVTDMKLDSEYGGVTFLPFTGYTKSDLFSGDIVPGAADIQVEDVTGYRNMCAKYMFRGKDSDGKDCFLFVENNGYLQPVNHKDPYIKATPRFITNSPKLQEYLSQTRFTSQVHGAPDGVTIKIFDVLKED